MKNFKIAFALLFAIALMVVNGCKKDDTTSSSSTKNSLTINSKVYTPIESQVDFDTTGNSCNLVCLATSGSDSLIIMTVFSSMNPSNGTHTLDTNGTDGMLLVLPSTFFGNVQAAISGNCTLTKSSGSYNVSFSNVDLIDTANVHGTLAGGYNATY